MESSPAATSLECGSCVADGQLREGDRSDVEAPHVWIAAMSVKTIVASQIDRGR